MDKDIAFYWDIRQLWYALLLAIISPNDMSVDDALNEFGIYLSEEKAKLVKDE